jgi:hypothetical protein
VNTRLRAEVEVAPSGLIDEEAAFAAYETWDFPRGLRDPWVKDQPIELQDVHAQATACDYRTAASA